MQNMLHVCPKKPQQPQAIFQKTDPIMLLEHTQNTSKMLPKGSLKAPKSDPFGGPGPTWGPKPIGVR